MRRLVSATLAKVLIVSMATFGVSAAVATDATAAPVSAPAAATNPQLDLGNLVNCVLELVLAETPIHCDHIF